MKMWHCTTLTSPVQVFRFLLLILHILLTHEQSMVYHDYCIIGAGPAGLQMGYFLKTAARDYIIYEKSNMTGSFFQLYPRHRTLISLNKRHTGQTNKEFNLRHDWNSLLSDDESLLFRHYSKKMFPHANDFLRYVNDFQQRLNISVQFKTEIRNLSSVRNESAPDGHHFTMEDQNHQQYMCRTMVLATGIAKPVIPNVPGMEYADGYEDVSLDPEDYEGKTVLILGRGNSAFEMADSIYGSTNLIHMVGRSRVRLSWATHYVGDLRAINNNILDTYMLKSLDGILEAALGEIKIIKKNDKLWISVDEESELDEADEEVPSQLDNFALREPYDKIIRCLGFSFDDSLFTNSTAPGFGKGRSKKFPLIDFDYESKRVPGMFFAGTISHSVDHRKSAGGFIHGFRYTARALHHMMEYKYEGVTWPSMTASTTQLMNHLLRRMNEASGIYQMFSILGDVIVLRNNGREFEYFEEFPIYMLHRFPALTGKPAESIIVLNMQYGTNFSGPGNDIFRLDRATGEPSDAHNSNFLHPVLYHYDQLPTEQMMKTRRRYEILPRPKALHHVVEDFLTNWDAPISHILPLRRFLENVLGFDMRLFFSQSCLQMAMTYSTVPLSCEHHFLNGQGLTATEHFLDTMHSNAF
ncbi:FAD-dependent oxidoreductase domain-containing protein 2-like [Gigantopelta aegis]|uniref:FAD-dependent oxidoreductase domain-containing protein 2-like n=1 Tax=Gigantopelta aegis TaxID=1735272 RepID=UPI001B8876F5|nr:FAD-dependent oxidoreductase domain-containing protein 2-like [Gigantopelta aegis]XP_041364525.1 FAD-dependent oxidoreductase domain-containing protein 2-like [Gigantopelta aegis]XP_041364526.1 FAD-dependent oxidoreductase domain-containing protein 2-like [Gigantopelta aegis]XP_041364527.1 FAD-dependent oxidoreductase domain-containing protein 2-like [Gigantopelta aegis]XP_041364528.1 FAD-dependent oxidoreductase domain-containing protein 2-like [Gigantopelta aegis]